MRTLARRAVLDVELSVPLRDHFPLEGYSDAQVLLRLHGEPLASLTLPVRGGRIRSEDLLARVIDEHAGAVGAALARAAILEPAFERRLDVARRLTRRP